MWACALTLLKLPTTSNPVGPLSDTRIHVAPHTFFFPQQLNSLPPSFLVGGTSRSIVKLTPHFSFSFSFSLYYKPIYIPNWLLVSGVPSTFKTNKSIFFFFFFSFYFFHYFINTINSMCILWSFLSHSTYI